MMQEFYGDADTKLCVSFKLLYATIMSSSSKQAQDFYSLVTVVAAAASSVTIEDYKLYKCLKRNGFYCDR